MPTITDNRQYPKKPIVRIEADTISIGAAVTTEVTTTIRANMLCRGLIAKVGDATNAITYTVVLKDSSGGTLYSQNAIPDNATTGFLFMTVSGTDLNMIIPLEGTITIGVTPSGAPGGNGVDVDIVLLGT